MNYFNYPPAERTARWHTVQVCQSGHLVNDSMETQTTQPGFLKSAIRGKHYSECWSGRKIAGAGEQGYVHLLPDVAKVFGDSRSVNKVLRAIISATLAAASKRKKSA